MYQERFYRKFFKGSNLVFFNVCIMETDITIGAEKNLKEEALLAVKDCRAQLEAYIKLNPEFLTSLEPLECKAGAPLIVIRMCEAAKKAGVGPMAAVAGAISELVGMELLKYSKEVIIENGGDIFISSKSIRVVGIYSGNSPFNDKLAIEITPQRTPLGICTSAGSIGHSLSFGKADAVVIISKDTFLADAVATATGNLVKGCESLENALEFALGIGGVEGALIILGDKMGAKGDIKLVGL